MPLVKARGLLFALTLCLLGPSASAFAQDINCEEPVTQAEMNICSSQSADKADAEMTNVWFALRDKTKAFDRDAQAPEGAGVSILLLKAQRAWIKFRDKQCNAEGAQYYGGSIRPTIQNGCIERMTQARTRELRAMMQSF